MLDKAIVIKITDDGTAEIELTLKPQCDSSCAICGGCAANQKQIRLIAQNKANACKGDTVLVERCGGKAINGAFFLYFMPVVFMILFYCILPLNESYKIAASIAGLLISFAIVFFIYGRKKKRIEYTITEVLR